MTRHTAIIQSSQRQVEVERHGRLLIVLGGFRNGYRQVNLCRYDHRFKLLPQK